MARQHWYHLDSRTLLLVASVGTATLFCNVVGESPPSTLSQARFVHGWPLKYMCRQRAVRGHRATDGLEYWCFLRPWPQPGMPSGVYAFDPLNLSINGLVAIAVVASTAYATERWCRSAARHRQVSVRAVVVWAPGLVAVALVLTQHVLRLARMLFDGFLWFGLACTAYTIALLARGLIGRFVSRGAKRS